MFSGIIQAQSQVLSINSGVFCVANAYGTDLSLGESIAHDGACMTLTDITAETYTFFVMEESLRKTNFGSKKVGDFFNTERSLIYGDRIDGHLVTGHIDTVGTVADIVVNADASWDIVVNFSDDFSKYVISKGSICINGVSLTVVNVGNGMLSVCVIPHTLSVTNIAQLSVGSSVNLEFDMVAKYITRLQQLHQ